MIRRYPNRVAMMATVLFVFATPFLVPRALVAASQDVAASGTGGSGAPPPAFDGLAPGKFVTYTQSTPVDVVLIGFEPAAVDAQALASVLPAKSAPLVRYPQFYGLKGRDLGLEFVFDHRIAHRDGAFAARLFQFLSQTGREGPPTLYQSLYNQQFRNVLDITGPVLYIDAPSVERWLVANDTARREDAYTVYFINWFGKPGFKFHVYTKTDEPDPDTGFAFGALAQTAMNAWGGSASRIWFYDFSAGPEWNTVNWVVDTQNIGGDRNEEYRMPPIWEYVDNGYRPASALGHDMGLLTRFVAINLLFTTSPLYDPLAAAPDPSGRRRLDITVFEDDPAQPGLPYVNASHAKRKLFGLQPYYSWRAAKRAVDPIDEGARRALGLFTLNAQGPDCWTAYGTIFAQLYCYFAETRHRYVPAYNDGDYVVPSFAFNTTDDGMGFQLGLLGFAEDNWKDGTQSFVFAFGTPSYRSSGYGLTSTLVHEGGHHIGMSHPHDGYDPELKLDYGPRTSLFFAWAGDESDTVMHYLSTSNGFSTYDRDNMARWECAGYLNWANALAGDLLASPQSALARRALREADAAAVLARKAFGRWDHLEAVYQARRAYSKLKTKADELGASTPTLTKARTPLPGAQRYEHTDRPRLLLERLAQPRP